MNNCKDQYCSREKCGRKFTGEAHLLPADKMHLVAVLVDDPADMPYCNANCLANAIIEMEEALLCDVCGCEDCCCNSKPIISIKDYDDPCWSVLVTITGMNNNKVKAKAKEFVGAINNCCYLGDDQYLLTINKFFGTRSTIRRNLLAALEA